MKTYTTFAAASWLLVAATGAMAAPFSADCGNSAAAGQPLTREAVIADLVASRQAPPTLPPHDGEWYNVSAPLGHMDGMGHMDHMGPMARQADMGAANAMPAGSSGMGTTISDAGTVSANQGTDAVACLSTSMR